MDLDLIQAQQREWQKEIDRGGAVVEQSANEALLKCSQAIQVMQSNLEALGYTWVSAVQIPTPDVEQRATQIERAIGASIPPVIKAFWKLVGEVSFVDLENYRHVDFWERHAITSPLGYCDGVHVEGCTAEWTAYILRDFTDWDKVADLESGGTGEYLLVLSPDGYHKDDISGGAPYGIYPGKSWAPTWEYFEWLPTNRPVTAPVGSLDFLSYLRTALLECAGFPGLIGSSKFELFREQILGGVPYF